ncbi:uncharacterized protein Z519_10083 [Cladophialophora bantiana CBS 173.52]|uniref:Uncharacterized protein n=1 Tax=Cladophialophora bantiana (strain ATCC 10958 / CBS 173.52 / CDC B-1940 / NIH 8579) TaxID=1442370 RepID=A0A0D2HEI2_CLAB1|nr:uncharacterized protein Z519_10083 [Cladophialophora bantiana CBS 173.52]KIW89230.1 hypothetical protein Z519_10083 [Cladophialophora bantiana CBS 173.52]
MPVSNHIHKSSGHSPGLKAGQLCLEFGRRIYHPFGFKRGYNFVLFAILVGALMGFVLARLQYLNIDGIFLKVSCPGACSKRALHANSQLRLTSNDVQKTIPGDAIHYQSGYKRVGIILHLACILPAGFLVCFQFAPVIRHKFLMFHRVNGYAIILLLLTGNAGAFMVIPIAGGGSPATQAGLGLLGTMTTVSVVLAYINIKRLQIDQHRAWMIRTWVYAGSVISVRLVQMAANTFIAQHQQGHWYDVQTCENIWKQYTLYGAPAGAGNPAPYLYPACTAPNSSEPVIIKANVHGFGPEFVTASFHLTFGMSVWLCLAIHAIGVETYLKLTPAESERLRLVSYERQLEAGFKHPGRAGLTVDRIGDAVAWEPIGRTTQACQSSSESKGVVARVDE